MYPNVSRLLLLLVILFSGCGSSQDKETLKQAADVHNAALAVSRDVEALLAQMSSDTTIHADSVQIIRVELQQWHSQLVEVPGNEEHDHGDNHHDHHHGPPLQVSAAEMLRIQEDLKESIDRIYSRALRTSKNRDS